MLEKRSTGELERSQIRAFNEVRYSETQDDGSQGSESKKKVARGTTRLQRNKYWAGRKQVAIVQSGTNN